VVAVIDTCRWHVKNYIATNLDGVLVQDQMFSSILRSRGN